MSDTIYRQDAIEAVDVKCLHRGIVKGIQGIIEDLPSAQPTQTNTDSTHENTLDCVSRQQVIDGIKKEILKRDRRFYKGLLVANHVILHLPSVQPERKKGKWIRVPGRLGYEEVECDQCNSVFWSWMANYSFCPSCGANMGSVRRCFT